MDVIHTKMVVQAQNKFKINRRNNNSFEIIGGKKMTRFIPVQYGKKTYPCGIIPKITEIPAHFDVKSIEVSGSYSLHTEYSYKARLLNSKLMQKYPILSSCHNRMVPQLWRSEEWAEEFATFIIDLVSNNPNPEIIEIHPPFKSYCKTIDDFISRYKIFENKIHGRFPKTIICLERYTLK